MHPIDNLLNRVTMYRLVVYVLAALSALGIGFALAGRMSTSATSMIISLLLLLASAYLTDRGFARLFEVPTNSESWLITALILFLILNPATSLIGGAALVLAGAFSSASKFILARHEKHFFNPAALSAALLSLTGLGATTWWIGGSLFWPFTLVLGLAVVRKIRRVPLVMTFAVASTGFQVVQLLMAHQPLLVNMQHALISSPLIFLATIMLTEPATMPPRRNQQIVFALAVAFFYIGGWQIGPLAIYPEVALLIGNVYAYIVSPKFRVRLALSRIERISDQVYHYVFRPNRAFNFLPGQYMEWTLADVPYDSRGNRRTFTIASSPTEDDVHLGIKYYDPASNYKDSFANLRPGDVVYASQLAGNFTMNGLENDKLAFIAGGIGITPFRSMVKYLLDEAMTVDVVLLYIVSDPKELAYLEEFTSAARVGIRTIPVVTSQAPAPMNVARGKISPELLARLLPDCADRTIFISGPNVMVDATKKYLRQLGTPSNRIKTDHFSGY